MLHSCSSCDRMVDVSEMDSYGRCLNCQEEFGDIDSNEYFDYPDEYFDDPVEEEEDEYWI